MIINNIWKVLLILIILSILGINVFFYIYRGADIVYTNVEKSIDDVAYYTGKGGEIVTKKTASTTKNILDELENSLIPKIEYKDPRYNSSNTDDRIISNKPITGKSGYCYIGSDNNYRTCVQVYPSDICMSGDIFPSMDICINPSLRA